MIRQKTIVRPVSLKGIGLHTGEDVCVEIVPAAPNTGVFFTRTDLPDGLKIPASVFNLVHHPRRTALGNKNAEVHTVEHLLATLLALGVRNLEVRVDGPELPGLDGSALPYVEALQDAGLTEQDAPAREIHLRSPVAVTDREASVVAVGRPDGLSVSYTLDYNSPLLDTQYFSVEVTEETFVQEIAPARTFVLEEEVRQLRTAGLGKGASTENTLVLGANGVIDNELRFKDEFVRHKILDLLGDLYLMSFPLCAHVVATKSGHSLNWQLAKSILEAEAPTSVPEEGHGRTGDGQGGLSDTTEPMDIRLVEKILPHRYPFLLVDRVLEIREGRFAKGLKNVTFNEEFFQGHFPGRPVMPGVLQVEAMAQLTGIVLLSRPEYSSRMAYLLSLDRVKFRRAIVPGDQVILEVELKTLKKRTVEGSGRAFVDGSLAAEATFRFMLMEND